MKSICSKKIKMDTGRISARYAKALLRWQKSIIAKIKCIKEMETIADSFMDVPELKRLLNPRSIMTSGKCYFYQLQVMTKILYAPIR